MTVYARLQNETEKETEKNRRLALYLNKECGCGKPLRDDRNCQWLVCSDKSCNYRISYYKHDDVIYQTERMKAKL